MQKALNAIVQNPMARTVVLIVLVAPSCRGVFGGTGKASVSRRPVTARFASLCPRARRLLVAHHAQTLAQRLEVIKRGVIDFRMVTAQDDLMLVVAENAALEFAGYGHGSPFGSFAAAKKD
jgi:hypothetical protein